MTLSERTCEFSPPVGFEYHDHKIIAHAKLLLLNKDEFSEFVSWDVGGVGSRARVNLSLLKDSASTAVAYLEPSQIFSV